MRERQVNALIQRIYRAPGGGPAEWHDLTLELAKCFGSEHSHLVAFDRIGHVHTDFATVDDASKEYREHYAVLDSAAHRIMRGARTGVFADREIVTSDELRTDPVQQELLPKYKLEYRIFGWGKTRNGLYVASCILRVHSESDQQRPSLRRRSMAEAA